MARIHRWSVMIYGSLHAEFMETMYNGNIHWYGTPIFVNLLSIYLNRLATIIKYFGGCDEGTVTVATSQRSNVVIGGTCCIYYCICTFS